MLSTYKIPEKLEEDIEKLGELTEKFIRGELSSAEYRSFRVPQGVYEQREDGTFMLRVRFPAGIVLPHHLRTLANVSRKYGNSTLHIITRQDIQVHRVRIDRIHRAIVELYEGRLSTKGGGGNTVRNITACPHAGVCTEEVFDVSPFATALASFLLPDPDSYRLPRKYKIAFSGCPRDCAGVRVNDLGYIARDRDGQRGFAVYAGGGMGARSRVGELLEEFIPLGEFHLVAEALKRVFDKHGNRKNRHKARLRFLVEQIGFNQLRRLYEQELAELRESSPALEIDSLQSTPREPQSSHQPPLRRLRAMAPEKHSSPETARLLHRRHPALPRRHIGKRHTGPGRDCRIPR